LTVTVGKTKVAVGVMVGLEVIVGVRVIVEVRVSVEVGRAVNVEVSVAGNSVVGIAVAVLTACPPENDPHARLITKIVINAMDCLLT
jgi:hypothetical protein